MQINIGDTLKIKNHSGGEFLAIVTDTGASDTSVRVRELAPVGSNLHINKTDITKVYFTGQEQPEAPACAHCDMAGGEHNHFCSNHPRHAEAAAERFAKAPRYTLTFPRSTDVKNPQARPKAWLKRLELEDIAGSYDLLDAPDWVIEAVAETDQQAAWLESKGFVRVSAEPTPAEQPEAPACSTNTQEADIKQQVREAVAFLQSGSGVTKVSIGEEGWAICLESRPTERVQMVSLTKNGDRVVVGPPRKNYSGHFVPIRYAVGLITARLMRDAAGA